MSESSRAEQVAQAVNGYTAQTIPVHVSLRVAETILCQPEVEALLRRAELIALGICDCREQQRHCDAPRDVCLTLDEPAREAIARGSARVADLSLALAALERSHQAGLVHLAYRQADGAVKFICSCCSCCCWFLTRLEQFDYHDAIVESAFAASFESATCTGCGSCVHRCPFGAWHVNEADSKTVALLPDRCFGCGLCVSTCPTGSIALVPRKDREG